MHRLCYHSAIESVGKRRLQWAPRAGATSSYVLGLPNVLIPGPNDAQAKNDSETQLHFIFPGDRG